MALTTQQVETLYLAYLGRKGYAEEVAFWQTLEITQEFAATGFYNSPEAQARGLTDNATYINQIYNDLFNRDAETAGLDVWLQLLANGFPRDQIALAIANAALSNPSGADGQTLQAAISDVPPGPGPGPEPTPGATFMLTNGVDVADGSGSSHDGVADTFKFTNAAETVEATAKTLTNGDTLNDGTAGDGDVLRLNLELAAGTNTIGAKNIGSGFSATNIEKLVINGSNANRTVFDNTINMLGLTDVQFSGDFLTEVNFDGRKKVIETLKTIDASDVTAGTVTVDASKASQALTITGPKELAATITGGKGDDTISAQGSINGGDGNDSITLTGAGTVKGGKGDDTISADVAGGTAISIDGEVGNDSITVSGGGKDSDEKVASVTIIGGKGEDVIDAGNLDSETKVSIDGGDGADVITVSGSGTVDAGAGDDIITVMAGTLTVNAGSGKDVIDSSNTGADDKVTINAGAGDDVIKLGDAIEKITFTSSSSTSAAKFIEKDGKDIITGFTAGSGGDVVDFGSALGSIDFDGKYTADGKTGVVNKHIIVVDGTSGTIKSTAASNTITIIDSTNGKVYFAKDVASNTDVALSGIMTDANNILTLTGVDATALVKENFIITP